MGAIAIFQAAAVVSTCTVVIVVNMKKLNMDKMIRIMFGELTSNGGGSVKDKVDKLVTSVDKLQKDHETLKRVGDDALGKFHDIQIQFARYVKHEIANDLQDSALREYEENILRQEEEKRRADMQKLWDEEQ